MRAHPLRHWWTGMVACAVLASSARLLAEPPSASRESVPAANSTSPSAAVPPAAAVPAGDTTAPAAEAAPGAETPTLDQLQQALQRDYERFEKSLYEVGEYTLRTDPERADLLFRARGLSQEQQILQQMRIIAQQLQEGKELGDVVVRQDDLVLRMQQLLKLLQSEDERDRLGKEIKRIEELIKDTNRLIGRQKDTRADTERGGKSKDLEGAERKVADEAQKLADKIDGQDAERAAEAQGNSSSPPEKPSDQGQPPQEGAERPPQGDQPPGEKPQGESPAETPGGQGATPESAPPMPGSDQPPSPGNQSPNGQDSPGNPSPPSLQPLSQSPEQNPAGAAPEGGPQEGEQSPQRTPGREELEQARRDMQRAIDELRAQNRDGASKDQDNAIARLEQMKAKLEEILRQLREEERELFLALLEARFQKMLRLQLQINAETVRLDKTPDAERTSRHFAKATQIGRDQEENATEADKALLLLKEEGSSVAFPEAIEQMRDNMRTVARRLQQTDTGETTQLIEQIIVETLDEMILALQKEMEKAKQGQQKPPPPGEPQEPSLVDALAELKMIRSLQNQVNRMTRQLGLEVEGEQATHPDTLQLLDDLSRRQQRIREATYDLSTGKNKVN